jgi:hypothetical protein
MTITFESCQFGDFLSKLTETNKKLAKLRQPALEVISVLKEIKRIDHKDREISTVTVSDPQVAKAGRSVVYIGTVSFEQGVKGIYSTKAAEDLDIVLGTIKDEDLRCDHCQVKRSRNKYMFFFEEGGLVSIGSSCAKDYFGWDIEATLQVWEDFATTEYEDDIGGKNYTRGNSFRDLLVALDWATHGFTDAWVSREKALTQDSTPTSSTVWPCLNDTRSEFIKHYGKEEVERFDGIVEKYRDEEAMDAAEQSVLSVWGGLTPRTDFDFNMKANLLEDLEPSGVGIRQWIVRPAIVLYGIYKALHVVVENTKKSNEWVGTIGAREVFSVKILEKKGFEGQYGMSYLVMMADAAGNSLKTFSTSADLTSDDVKAGDEIRIKATVKSHEDYMGRKQTMLSRVAVIA